MSKVIQWLKRLAIISLLLGLLTVLTFPWWFPLAAKHGAGIIGATWERTERVGLFRLVLHKVHFAHEPVTVTADAVTLQTPPLWLLNRWRKRVKEPFLAVDGFHVRIDETETAREPRDAPSTHLPAILSLVDQILGHVESWAPHVSATRGEVVLDMIDLRIIVREVNWREGELEGNTRLIWKDHAEDVGVTFRRPPELPWTGRVNLPGHGLQWTYAFGGDLAEWSLESALIWREQTFPLTARWDSSAWIPVEATFMAEEARFPASLIGLKRYDEIRTSLLLQWRQDTWQAAISGAMEPLPEEAERLPPVMVETKLSGNLEHLLIEQLEWSSPWAHLSLQSPSKIHRDGRLISAENRLQILTDLRHWPLPVEGGVLALDLSFAEAGDDGYAGVLHWNLENGAYGDWKVATWTGQIDWEIPFRNLTQWTRWPDLTVEVYSEAQQIATPQIIISSIRTQFAHREGNLRLDEARLSLPGESQLTLQGEVRKLTAHPEFDLRASLQIEAEEFFPYIPDSLQWERIQLYHTLTGPLSALETELNGEIESLVWTGWKPQDFRFTLAGSALGEASLNLAGSSPGGTWEMGTVLDFAPDGSFWEGTIHTLTLAALEHPEPARLVEEARFRVSRESANESNGAMEWAFALENFHWRDDRQSIAVDLSATWPRQGTFALRAGALNTGYAEIFIPLPEGPWDRLDWEDFTLDGTWDEGPLTFTFRNRTLAHLTETTEVDAQMEISGDASGISLREWTFREGERDLFLLEGHFPLTIHPFPGNSGDWLELDLDAPFNLRAQTSPRATFWRQIGALARLDLGRPEVSAELGGTLARPSGDLRARLAHLAPEEGSALAGRLPRLTDLRFDLHFDEKQAHLQRLDFSLDGQFIGLEARLPLGRGSWENLILSRTLPDWREMEGHLRIPEVKVEAVATYFPQFIARQGSLQADFHFRPGGRLEGEINLQGAATRPFLPMGAIQQLQGRLLLEDRKITIEEMTGRIGGEKALLRGSAELAPDRSIPYRFSLTGENLPLARQPGLIIRGDLDLLMEGILSGDPSGRLSGDIALRDSFLLSELRFQAPGSVTTPAQRPPYFSVDIPPFDQWALDIRIRGRDFLTVRSTVFSGILGTTLRLGGTLREPEATGEIELRRGTLRFPFGRLALDQGVITLTEDNPFLPLLAIRASGRVFGYDINLDVSGTAEDPVVLFTSTPPLSSEEILLMVTAGELPARELEFTGQQRATRLALYLGQNLLYGLTGDEAESERLSIEGGRNISRQGRETYLIEYRLRERLHLLGEYDEFDAVNVGLRFRLFSR